MHIYIYIAYLYIYIYIHTYIHIYIYIYMHLDPSKLRHPALELSPPRASKRLRCATCRYLEQLRDPLLKRTGGGVKLMEL